MSIKLKPDALDFILGVLFFFGGAVCLWKFTESIWGMLISFLSSVLIIFGGYLLSRF